MRVVFIFILCAVQLYLNAQDSIYKRTGLVIPAKISEVNIKEISYKRLDLLDGPLFIINKNEIQKIKYANGTIDSFMVLKEGTKAPNVVFVNPRYIAPDFNQIQPSIRRGTYKYQGHLLSDRHVFLMALEKNNLWKNTDIELNVIASKKHKVMQYSIGYSGAIIGGIGLYASAIAGGSSSNSNDASLAAFAGILSAGIAVSSQIISFKYKLKRVKHADRVAELYNQLSKN
ncbi:MAG: hypothetical protein IPL10_06200 [Bacteroidetes bacterium]|nr:hypothetical protein [Bacteroidota bacterium]